MAFPPSASMTLDVPITNPLATVWIRTKKLSYIFQEAAHDEKQCACGYCPTLLIALSARIRAVDFRKMYQATHYGPTTQLCSIRHEVFNFAVAKKNRRVEVARATTPQLACLAIESSRFRSVGGAYFSIRKGIRNSGFFRVFPSRSPRAPSCPDPKTGLFSVPAPPNPSVAVVPFRLGR